MALDSIILAIIIATLAAIVYSMRVLVIVERRIARIDKHLELMVKQVLKEEKDIESMLKGKKKKK